MNQDVKRILKNADCPIFIWGAGSMGKAVYEKLSGEGISCSGYVTDDGTADANSLKYTKDQVLGEKGGFLLVRGFLKAYYMKDDEIYGMWPGCRGVYSVPDAYEPGVVEEMTEEFYEAHRDSFQKVRDGLEDELSKKSFDAFITAKTTKRADSLLPYVVMSQYFFEPAPWARGGQNKPDVLVDCGAFTGDSILDFVKEWGDGYAEIIACEPDPHNYEKLQQTIRENGIKNVTTLPIGLHSSKTVLRFRASGDMSSEFDVDGELELRVDTIDNISGNKDVSIIKMDIEGAEMNALQGAKNTIARCRPMLMISAYHKKDDLFQIYQLINDTVDNYKYYFRCHKPMPIDAVLYAVPDERAISNAR